METNTIELTTHTIITVDENIAIRFAVPAFEKILLIYPPGAYKLIITGLPAT
jgi:hypothetical protein